MYKMLTWIHFEFRKLCDC